MPKLTPEILARFQRQDEHNFSAIVINKSQYGTYWALSELRRIVSERPFLTRSPINAALMALYNEDITVGIVAAQVLLAVADPKTDSAIRCHLQNPKRHHELTISFLKETLAKINRKQQRKKPHAA